MSRQFMKKVDSCQAKCEFMLASNVSAAHQDIHIHCHRTVAVLCHLPSYIPANSSTAVSFHITLDSRLNATSDSDILLLIFVGTCPHNCSPQIHMRSNRRLIINFYCPVLYLLHLCNVSIIWFSIVIHTLYLLLLSIKPLSLHNTFMGVSLWVYACQMFSASSAEARPSDSHNCSSKEFPVTPGVALAWFLGWTGPPQHLPLKEARNALALQETLSSNIILFKSWN